MVAAFSGTRRASDGRNTRKTRVPYGGFRGIFDIGRAVPGSVGLCFRVTIPGDGTAWSRESNHQDEPTSGQKAL